MIAADYVETYFPISPVQVLTFGWREDIRVGDPIHTRKVCFDAVSHNSPVTLYDCHGMKGNQLWRYRKVGHGGSDSLSGFMSFLKVELWSWAFFFLRFKDIFKFALCTIIYSVKKLLKVKAGKQETNPFIYNITPQHNFTPQYNSWHIFN